MRGAGPSGGPGGRPRWAARGAAFTALSLAFALASGCRQLVGLDDIGCVSGCSADRRARLECEAGGRVRAVACEAGSWCEGGACGPCVDRCEGDNARVACEQGPGALPEPCPAERPFCQAGACVGCRAAGDCAAAPDNPCINVEVACEAGECVERRVELAAGRKLPDPVPGDCTALFCNGAGAPFEQVDLSDVLDDGDECTTEHCAGDGSMVLHGNEREGAGCHGGNGQCNGAGVCSYPLQLTSGGTHTCALMTDGTVHCWGANQFGQLGDLSTDSRANPLPVAGFGVRGGRGLGVRPSRPGERTVAAGVRHTCVIADYVRGGKVDVNESGLVYCWGQGAVTDESGAVTLPKQILLGYQGVHSLAGHGSNHACALFGERVIACWGLSSYGQLGDGLPDTGGYRAWAVTLPEHGDGVSVVSLDTGGRHACALLSDGALYCWGGNDSWQLNGKACPCPGEVCEPDDQASCNEARSLAPVPVLTLPLHEGERAERVEAGWTSTCALTSEGRVLCWGYNGFGELGRPPNQEVMQAPLPMFMFRGEPWPDAGEPWGELRGAVAMSLGMSTHGCGVGEWGGIFCWGANDAGQVATWGPGPSLPAGCHVVDENPYCLPTPLASASSSKAIQVVAGGSHSCALLDDASVWCWGDNFDGQRGNGSFSQFGEPPIHPPSPVVFW